MTDQKQLFRLKPQYSIVAHDPNIVELRMGVWNPVSITLSDRKASGKLLSIVQLLDGTKSIEQIAKEANAGKREVEDVVSYLQAHDALSTGPENILDYQLSIMQGTLGGMEIQPEDRKNVFILSDSSLGTELAENVLDFAPSAANASWDDPSVQLLRQQDFTLNEDLLGQHRTFAKYDDWKDRFVVVILETIDPILLRNIGRLSLHHGFSWMHAALDGPFLLVGPIFIPGKSPCYECFEGRVALNIRESSSYVVYKKALAEKKVLDRSFVLPKPIRQLLTALTAFEVVNLVATGCAFTIGKALSVYLPMMAFAFNEVLRLPACPACSPITEQSEETTYFHVKGFINELYGISSSNGK